ncbi:MAG: hypothetical protein RLP44_25355 [Aggregatilineales bacterium]
MKVTIWHQFSSNHSASYTIVGEFPTPERAQEVREIVADILIEIMLRYAEKDELVIPVPMEIETEIGNRYGFDWQQPVDWLVYEYGQRRDPRKFVVNQGNYVVVGSNYWATWQTGHQFKHLLQVLGAETKAEIVEGYAPNEDEPTFENLDCQFTCVAPSEEVAERLAGIFDKVSKKWIHIDPNFPRGLLLYHPQFDVITKGMQQDDFLREESLYFERAQVSVSVDGTIDEEKLLELVPQDPDIAWNIGVLNRDLAFRVRDVVRDGRTIEVHFSDISRLWLLMPALSGWLESQGCEVGWKITQRESLS